MTRLSRRRFLASLGVPAAAIGIDSFFIEPHRLEVTLHHLSGAAPVSEAVLTVAHLSDLHLQRVGAFEHRIAEGVGQIAPDVIVFTGDSVDRRWNLPLLAAFLDLLDPRTPKFAILGNWEYQCHVDRRLLAETYAARNCRLLINESVVYRHRGRDVLITGLDDLLAGSPSYAHAVDECASCANHLLLAHCPAQRDLLLGSSAGPDANALARHSPQYMLSGHTHGGQVNLYGFCPWRPSGSGRYVSGWYNDVRPQLYVSRGLGTVDVPIRFGARPELSILRWPLRDIASLDTQDTTRHAAR